MRAPSLQVQSRDETRSNALFFLAGLWVILTVISFLFSINSDLFVGYKNEVWVYGSAAWLLVAVLWVVVAEVVAKVVRVVVFALFVLLSAVLISVPGISNEEMGRRMALFSVLNAASFLILGIVSAVLPTSNRLVINAMGVLAALLVSSVVSSVIFIRGEEGGEWERGLTAVAFYSSIYVIVHYTFVSWYTQSHLGNISEEYVIMSPFSNMVDVFEWIQTKSKP